MTVETNCVDSHGASLIGFGITRLLNFDLVARFKQINVMKLPAGLGPPVCLPAATPSADLADHWWQGVIPTVRYSSVWRVARAVFVSSAAAQRNTLGSPRPESVSH